MTIELSLLFVLGFLGGTGLGFYYFGGLWLTVKKIPLSRNPNWLLFWSAVFRLTPTLLAFYFVVKAYPAIFLIMLPGFFGVRYCMIRRISNGNRGQAHAA